MLNLLSRPPSASNNGYFIKLLLLSKQSILVEKGLVLLLETESSLSSWTNIDRSLHLILAGRGLLHHCTSVTTLWDSIHRTLLSVASLDGRQLSDKDGYKRIFYLALKKLRSSGRVSFACKLLFDYLKMPRVLLKGVGNTLGLLNHFLERNAAVLENAVSPLKPQIKVLDTGEFDLVIIVESLKL